MNPQDLDAQSVVGMLQPLREPGTIAWWPPAPGWWILAVLGLTLLGFALRGLYRFHQRAAPLRQARQCLEDLHTSAMSPSEKLAELAQLQRRLAIRISGRGAVAGLTGDNWTRHLNAMAPSDEPYFDVTMAEVAYRPNVGASDYEDAFGATQRWLTALRRPK